MTGLARPRRTVAIALFAGFVAACGDGGAALDRLAEGESGKVVAVPSGVELKLDNGLDVRLAGVVAPFPEEPGGPQAQAALAKLATGRRVELRYGGARRDSRGRALAQGRRTDDRQWLEGALLREGLAETRTWADNRALAHDMLEDEAKARGAGKGLWGAGVFRVLLPREVAAAGGGFQIVEGRVLSLTPTHGGSYLEFSPDRRGFAAEVAPAALPDLADAGVAAPSLVGRLVRVRGEVAWNGVMQIDHPEQIEVLKAP